MKTFEYKVLQVIDRLEVGGAERVFLDMTTLLLNKNIQVDTMLISGRGALSTTIDARAGKYFLDRKFKYNLFKLRRCAQICDKYQIVHVHMRHTYAYVKLAQLIAFKKFTIIFHDHYGDVAINSAVPFTLKGLFKPSCYIGVSQQLVDWALQKLNVHSLKAFLLANTVIPKPNYNEVLKNQRGDLLVVSNLRPTKNIELAIELANRLKRKLTIYGNTYESKYSETIQKLIQDSAYIDLVNDENDVPKFFKNFRLAIHTSYSETGPLVLLEYLASGLPFLAHATGEVADILQNELPECFIQSLDVTQWMERIEALEISGPASEKLKNLFIKYFAPEKYAEKCVRIYTTALDGNIV